MGANGAGYQLPALIDDHFDRGGVVDEPALIEALKSGKISAGLDVFPNEPEINPEFLKLDNVVVLPHMGTE